MAIGAGSTVSPKIVLAPVVQGPLFGIVESGAGPFIVLWANGTRVSSVDAGTIDEILAGTGATAAALVGRRVTVTSPTGQNNWAYCVCIAVYKRSGTDYALLQNPTGEYYIEVLASNCEALEN